MCMYIYIERERDKNLNYFCCSTIILYLVGKCKARQHIVLLGIENFE